jgi:hypothetical protein
LNIFNAIEIISDHIQSEVENAEDLGDQVYSSDLQIAWSEILKELDRVNFEDKHSE